MKNTLLRVIYFSLQGLVAIIAIFLTILTNSPTNYLLAALLIFCQFLSTWILLRRSLVYMNKTLKYFHELSEGKNPKGFSAENSLFKPIIEAGEKIAKKYKETGTFAKSIGAADFTASLKVHDENDVLGNAMLDMKSKLQKVHQEDTIRNWGIKKLNELHEEIRKTENLEDLDTTLKELITVLSANQGIFYTVDKNNQKIESKAVYAYSRKKFLNKKFNLEEGLVGQCYLEKELIELTEIPKNYVNITSGLGEATPSYLILVPAKIESEVFGIIEIASFRKFEEHEKELLVKFSSQLALNIQSIQISKKTVDLLKESNDAKEQLLAQEEELRQNLEELITTQEANERQKRETETLRKELDDKTKLINQTMIISESDAYGNITYVNDKFTEVSGYTASECLGRSHNILRHPDNPKSFFQDMWATIKSGKAFKAKFPNLKKNGETYWVDSIISPILNEQGEITKYINIRYDISEQVKLEKELQLLKA